MKLHAQLTLDYGRQKPLEVFKALLVVFQRQGFAREQFCTLDNWRSLEKAKHFHIQGSLFPDIAFVPITNHRLDLLCIDGETNLGDLERVLGELVTQFTARQAFLHSADYYHWQNAEQPMEYECAGRDHSMLPKVHNGLPPPLDAMWIDISRNPGRRYLREGFQEAVSSPMWLRDDQITKAKADEIGSRPGFLVTSHEAHYCVRHSRSPFDEDTHEEQESLRAVCFGRPNQTVQRTGASRSAQETNRTSPAAGSRR